MKFIIKLFPEVIIKSKPVRKKLIAQLKKNLRKLLSEIHPAIEVLGSWDYVEVKIDEALDSSLMLKLSEETLEVLRNTPGIDFILSVKSHPFSSLEDIAEVAVNEYAPQIKGKTFCVRVKRSGKHAFNSIQAEQKVGGALLANSESNGVQLKNPEFTVSLEIKQDKLLTIQKRTQGLGGFPMGQQESCVSLISGGYDSSVATYLMMKRGIRTHFCFFNLGGMAHEVGVKQVSHYLWKRYSASHRVLFITIPFEEVVNEILKSIHHSQMGVVLKRMMLRVAEKVAQEFNAPALVTGECVGQVSSQTLTNLSVIDKAVDTLTLRPLITMDKQDIISLSRQTGTEEFAAVMPEYCGIISDKPTTCAKLDRIEHQETNFDFSILEQAFADRKVENIDQIYQTDKNLDNIDIVSMPDSDDIIIDIRHPHELASKPLFLTKNEVLSIPFFKLSNESAKLNKEKTYLLYCDKGIMSQLQAETLSSQGFAVKVYQPA
ncbi:tRNA uracil 4-sulfurtransferase ThiI [Aliikangiella sp. IMCC44632]